MNIFNNIGLELACDYQKVNALPYIERCSYVKDNCQTPLNLINYFQLHYCTNNQNIYLTILICVKKQEKATWILTFI